MATDQQMLTFLVDKDLLENIDTFRFEQRFQSRAEAIRWLLEWALSQEPRQD